MANGVDLINITVTHIVAGKVGLTIQLEVSADSELEAISWLADRLDQDNG